MKQKEFSLPRWMLIFFAPVAAVILVSGVCDYFIDPLWQWPHSRHPERWHARFNERQQKTNYLASREVDIDTLIFGSSITSNFNPEWLGAENGFNYAVNGGHPREFAAYIEYAKERSGLPVRLIMIEAATRSMVARRLAVREPSFYIENAKSKGKKAKNLFSLTAIWNALKTTKTPKPGYYFVNRLGAPRGDMAPDREFSSDEEKQQAIASSAKYYREGIYSNPYDEAYPQYLADIRKAAGDAEIIFYTPPVTWQLLKAFVEMDMLEGYEQRLRALVAEFGKVYHFFYPNGFAMDNAHFSDTHHPTNAAAELITGIIMRLRSGEVEEDTEHGGILLTQENIEEWLPVFREKMEGLASHPPQA